jgi:hypothetical protein
MAALGWQRVMSVRYTAGASGSAACTAEADIPTLPTSSVMAPHPQTLKGILQPVVIGFSSRADVALPAARATRRSAFRHNTRAHPDPTL